ncbi:hypothetical protein C5167_030620, partial [Papaver somniferum]
MGSDKKRRDIPETKKDGVVAAVEVIIIREEELRHNWECMMPEQTVTHRSFTGSKIDAAKRLGCGDVAFNYSRDGSCGLCACCLPEIQEASKNGMTERREWIAEFSDHRGLYILEVRFEWNSELSREKRLDVELLKSQEISHLATGEPVKKQTMKHHQPQPTQRNTRKSETSGRGSNLTTSSLIVHVPRWSSISTTFLIGILLHNNHNQYIELPRPMVADN